jgi:hypothetical protein
MTQPQNVRLGKLIRLLASDKPGEVAAAAQAIGRQLQSSGRDFHTLADIVERQLDLPGVPQQSRPAAVRHPRAGKLRIGDIVECTDREWVFRRCSCGSTRFTVKPGAGPHVAQLRCVACNVGGRWLSRQYMDATP